MSIWSMSVSGGILILIILILRGLFQNRLPRQTFLALWAVVLFRLLIPVSVPADCSVYHLLGTFRMERVEEQWSRVFRQNAESGNYRPEKTVAKDAGSGEVTEEGQTGVSDHFLVWKEIWKTVYLWGVFFCVLSYLFLSLKCYREFRISLPVKHVWIQKWVQHVPMRRNIQVRQMERITTPMTYGVFHPVILLPKNMDLEDTEQLQFVLTHEAVHIRRLDVVKKMFLAAAVCIYWFHPLVWIMYVLANRDLELACDEGVIRQFGQDSRAAYAYALISLAERKNSRIPLGSGFSKNAMEERIVAIMKKKKITIGAAAAAIVLVIAVTVFFATSAPQRDIQREDTMVLESQDSKVSADQEITQEAVKEEPQEMNHRALESDDGTAAWEEEIQKIYQEIYHSQEFSDYEKFGLSYDEKNGYLLYKNEMVGYFKDEMSPGLYRRFTDEKGKIALVVSRDAKWKFYY